jgi:hypothetical protein
MERNAKREATVFETVPLIRVFNGQTLREEYK